MTDTLRKLMGLLPQNAPNASVPFGSLAPMPATPVPGKNGGMFGYGVRNNLYPGEQSYFQQNPNVTGMASESGHVVLNPYSPSDVNRDAVARNEAFRLLLRDQAITPSFPITQDQRSYFQNTPYQGNESAMRETIAARLYSSDPSITPTTTQNQWLARFLMGK